MQTDETSINSSARKQSLSTRLSIWFLLISLVPVILVSFISYNQAKSSLKTAAIKELEHSSVLTVRYIQDWFNYRFTDLLSHSNDTKHKELLSSLIDGFEYSQQPLMDYVYSYDWASRVEDYQSSLINLRDNYNYVYDVFLIDKKGNILFTVEHEADFGTNLFSGPYADTLFAKTARQSLALDRLLFSDIEPYAPSNGRIDGFIMKPVKNSSAEIIGIMAIQVRMSDIYEFLKESNNQAGLRYYLVGQDGLLRSSLKDFPAEILVTKDESYQFQAWINAHINSDTGEHQDHYSHEGHHHDHAHEEAEDYLSIVNTQVIGFHHNLQILNVNWALVSEIDKDVALASAKWLEIVMLMLVIISVLVASVVSFYQARRITRPIKRLAKAAMAVAAGEQNQYVEVNKNDEIARLAKAFNYMLMMRSMHEKALEQSHAEAQEALGNMTTQQEKLVQATHDAELAVKAKSEFLASMSHEIRTPMNGVLGMLGLLLKSELNKQQKHQVTLARSSANSLLAVINDILDFSKIEAGKLDIEVIDFNLRDMIGEFSEVIGHRSADEGVELIFDLTGITQDFIRGDSGRIRQILSNLVGNALKFTHAGDVLVTASLEQTLSTQMKLTCSVKDTGIGIPTHKLGQLFSAFTQVDASTTRKYGGSGLGLAIVKQLCQIMGGDINVTSQEGQGSCFSFYLMLDSSEKSKDKKPYSEAHGLSLLVVDDHSLQGSVLDAQLTLWGAKVDVVQSAKQALALLHKPGSKTDKAPYDALIVDMFMPDISGVEFVNTIRQQSCFDSLSIVIMTSLLERGDDRVMKQLGVCEYFPKPVTTNDLFNAIDAIQQDQGFNRSALEQKNLNTDVFSDAPEADDSKAYDWPENARILLVEDNQINQTVALSLLDLFGLSADVANSGLEALDALKQSPLSMPYQLVLMDCQMPLMDGYDATREIRSGAAGERYQSVPVIAMTANAMKGDREKCIKAGMNDYISKPIDTELLERKLVDYLIQDASESIKNEIGSKTEQTNNTAKSLSKTENSQSDLTDMIMSNVENSTDSIAIWDTADALKRVMGKEKILKVLIASFLSDMPNYVASLDSEMQAGDIAAAAKSAHAIKGSAGNLSTLALADLAKTIERACLDEAPASDIMIDCEKLKTCFDQSCRVLNAWLNQQS